MVQLKFARGKANASDGKWIKSSLDNISPDRIPLLKDTSRTTLLSYFPRNLVGMYGTGSDGSLQRHFLIDDILFQSGDICNKVA